MTVVELATCHVPADPASPAPVVGYVVACSAFYERGFGAPTDRFLDLLLQFYGLELHHLTPLGILHITAFITLYEYYKGLSPTLICGTTSSASGNGRTWMWKRRCGATQTSMSGSSQELTHTSNSRSPTRQLDGRKSGSSRE
jgi:hypothetical protein